MLKNNEYWAISRQLSYHFRRGVIIIKETWKPVVGFDKYKVSNKGRLVSFHKKEDGYLMSQSDDKDGYKKATLSKDGKEFTRRIHVLVAQSFIPNPENLPVTNHLDGVKDNNSVENLEWTTVKENTIHGYQMSLNNNVGEKHHYAKKYEVLRGNTVIGSYTNMHELESALKTDRGTIGSYLKENQLIFDELKIREVNELNDSVETNKPIVTREIKGVLNPIALETMEETVYYSSLSDCAKLNGFSREGLRDRLKDRRIYKKKYAVKKVSQYFLLTTEDININQVIG